MTITMLGENLNLGWTIMLVYPLKIQTGKQIQSLAPDIYIVWYIVLGELKRVSTGKSRMEGTEYIKSTTC